MKKRKTTILFVVIFFIGLSLLLYPAVSNSWNRLHQSRVINDYAEAAGRLEENDYDRMLNDARAYNENLRLNSTRFLRSADEPAAYETLLDVSGNGIIGYVEIPTIDVSLAVFHGTDESVLQVAAGHIEGSSLPVGGESTHAVLTAHRGLPSAKLFTNIDKLTAGDQFFVRVLDELLIYEVDQIEVVEPHEVDALRIEEGKDLCTLVTCTPYSVNSHRLLVRGQRVDSLPDVRLIDISGARMDSAPVVAVVLLLLFTLSLFRYVWRQGVSRQIRR